MYLIGMAHPTRPVVRIGPLSAHVLEGEAAVFDAFAARVARDASTYARFADPLKGLQVCRLLCRVIGGTYLVTLRSSFQG